MAQSFRSQPPTRHRHLTWPLGAPYLGVATGRIGVHANFLSSEQAEEAPRPSTPCQRARSPLHHTTVSSASPAGRRRAKPGTHHRGSSRAQDPRPADPDRAQRARKVATTTRGRRRRTCSAADSPKTPRTNPPHTPAPARTEGHRAAPTASQRTRPPLLSPRRLCGGWGPPPPRGCRRQRRRGGCLEGGSSGGGG